MLERADFPEQVGVDSDVVADLLKYYDFIKMRIDSLIVIRNNKVACECHWKPNAVDTPHDMYSLSKSIVATAIGIAYDEGIISLDTKIFPTYFPERLEKMKGKQREWAEELNIHHIISMRAGIVTSVFDDKEKSDWVDAFLGKPIQFKPGTDWKYISENAFMLSWILQKETGLTVTEYLTPRFYEPLGIKVPHWEKNHDGIDAGGWGLKLTADDLSKIAILYLNKGMFDGKRIFSEEWFNIATTPYTHETYPIFTDKTEYGYQIWIDHENDDTTYRFTGLYGQFIFIYPAFDAAVVITASDNRDAEFIHPVYSHFPNAFIEPTQSIDEGKKSDFKKMLSSKEYLPDFKNAASKRNYAMEKKINDRLIRLLPVPNLSTQGATTFFMWRKKIGYLNDIKFDFSKDEVAFSFKEKDSERAVINAGMNGSYVRNTVILGENKLIIDAQATWNKNGSLELFLYNIGRPQTKRLIFKFRGNTVHLISKCDPGFADIAKFNIEFNMGTVVNESFEKLIRIAAPVAELFYCDPNSIGRFVD